MRKTSLIALLLALLFSVGASAEGILPVLQTPPPELTETVSWHEIFHYDSTPAASTTAEGGYRYDYTGVGCASFVIFGRALAQEGYALASSEMDGKGTLLCAAEKDGVALQLAYNGHTQDLRITYPPRVLAREADAQNPYAVDEGVESILPEPAQTISLHAVTGCSRGSVSRVENGYQYRV